MACDARRRVGWPFSGCGTWDGRVLLPAQAAVLGSVLGATTQWIALSASSRTGKGLATAAALLAYDWRYLLQPSWLGWP
jgi:hypothetical protein